MTINSLTHIYTYIYIYSVLVIYHVWSFSTLNFVMLGYIILFAFQYFTPCRYHTVDHASILLQVSQFNLKQPFRVCLVTHLYLMVSIAK